MTVVKFAFVAVVSALALVACTGGGTSQADTVLGLTGNADDGKTVYQAECASCHGDDGKSGSAGNNITSEGDDEIVETMIDGKGDEMPAFGESLSDQELADVLAYVKSL